jgi:hypothetical protein
VSEAVALDAISRGWHVFPAERGGKRPRAGWRWLEWHTTDPGRVGQWWADSAWNVGIATGPSGLIVVDLDVPDAGESLPPPWDQVPGVTDGSDVFALLCERHGEGWPDSYTVQTPSGGTHIYYTADDHQVRNSAGKLGPCIDIRAIGGYVIAAGSWRPDGAYELINDNDPVSLPGWLADLAASAPPEPVTARARTGHSDAYAAAALAREAEAVATAPPGTRNDRLNRAAFAVGRFAATGELDADKATATLTAAAVSAGLGPAEARKTITSGFRARRT